MPQPEQSPLIRASELTQYSFCHRAWWLSTAKGLPSEHRAVLDRGKQIHGRHEQQVRAAIYWQRIGWILLGGGSLILMAAFVWFWFL